MPTTQTPKTLLGALALAGATVATWWIWLGWDTEYQVDPVTQVSSGPYEPYQVVGCVLTIGALAAVAGLLLRPWVVVVTMAASFTVAWSVGAASTDDSGLWVVGAVLVAGGMVGGTALCAFGAHLLRQLTRSNGRRGPASSAA